MPEGVGLSEGKMEVDSNKHPFLAYILSLKPLRQPLMLQASSSNADIDIEANNKHCEVMLNQMPNLRQPELLAKMRAGVSDVVQTRSVLEALGERPDHEAYDAARLRITQIESALSKRLEEIVLADAPQGRDLAEWKSQQARLEREARDAADKEKLPYKAVVNLYEMHVAYGDLLKDAEARLVEMYRLSDNGAEPDSGGDDVDEEVVRTLQEASEKHFEKVELRGRALRFLPEAFGKLRTLISLDISNNKLEVLSDSIAGLVNLEILDLSCNSLVSLPDSIGLLNSLKVLKVSGNKLKALPDSISSCSGLIELDASFNELTYLPTNLGHGLVKLEKLSVHLNKLRSLPSSVCEMKSLRYLDIHFNEIRFLPDAIGNLTDLQVLNASSNFNDLVSIPDSIGELTNLVELDLSNNQIRELPYSFGRLGNLKKLNLDQNPLVIPPMEIVENGVEAVKEYMAMRWLDYLVEEEQRCSSDINHDKAQNTWLQWGESAFGGWISGVKESVTGYFGGLKKSPTDDYLEQQY